MYIKYPKNLLILNKIQDGMGRGVLSPQTSFFVLCTKKMGDNLFLQTLCFFSFLLKNKKILKEMFFFRMKTEEYSLDVWCLSVIGLIILSSIICSSSICLWFCCKLYT